MNTKKTPNKLRKLVWEFNRRFPVGSRVILRRDSGEVETTVTAAAMVLEGHSAVAWFDGVRGAYSIENDRVRPAATNRQGAC